MKKTLTLIATGAALVLLGAYGFGLFGPSIDRPAANETSTRTPPGRLERDTSAPAVESERATVAAPKDEHGGHAVVTHAGEAVADARYWWHDPAHRHEAFSPHPEAPRTGPGGSFDPDVAPGAGSVLWFEMDDALFVGVEREQLTSRVTCPRMSRFAVDLVGIDDAEAWRMYLYPRWLDPDDDPHERDGAGNHGTTITQCIADSLWLSRRANVIESHGSRVTEFRIVGDALWTLYTWTRGYDLDTDLLHFDDPEHVRITAVKQRATIPFVVLESDGATPAAANGRYVLGDAANVTRSDQRFAGPRDVIGWFDLDDGEHERLWFLFDDGETHAFDLATVRETVAKTGPLRVVRGTGRAPWRLRVPPSLRDPAVRLLGELDDGRIVPASPGESFGFDDEPVGYFARGDEVIVFSIENHSISNLWLLANDGRLGIVDADRFLELSSSSVPAPAVDDLIERTANAGDRWSICLHEVRLPGATSDSAWSRVSTLRLRQDDTRGWCRQRSGITTDLAPLPESWDARVGRGAEHRFRFRTRSSSEWIDLTPR